MPKSIRLLFIWGNLALVLLLGASVIRDNHKEWRKYQQEYYRLEAEDLKEKLSQAVEPEEIKDLGAQIKAKKRMPIEVKQIIAKDLDRIDRCITCHLGIDQKGFEEALASGVDILVSMTSILVKIGDGFAQRTGKRGLGGIPDRPCDHRGRLGRNLVRDAEECCRTQHRKELTTSPCTHTDPPGIGVASGPPGGRFGPGRYTC